MAEGGSAAGEEAANANADGNAASSPPPCSSSEGGGTKPLSAAEYARRVHQWLWDSYCGDISKFAMHYIIEEIDEDTSMEDLQKMMIVALIYRLLVCFYELMTFIVLRTAKFVKPVNYTVVCGIEITFLLQIICIWGAGGATPGKFLLGLRVVTCETSVLIAPSRVLVIPSSNVSMTTSTVRALIKNFSIASFFPAFITLLFFQHNRTAYDIVAGTIVVRRNGVR
ncbi:family with sequence similarity 8 member A1 [Turdus rufiventris]|nr:family with sequence similarity 8 member A1 [Turdus rufiventris]